MAATRNAPTRQDTFLLTVTLNGNSLGVWDKKTGGGIDSNELKYQPGGINVPPLSLGGKKIAGNVTLQREYDRVDDHDKINTLYNAAGRGKVTISQRPLDFDENPYGRALLWTGTLKKVQEPDVDSEGGNTAALIEIEVTISGYPSAV